MTAPSHQPGTIERLLGAVYPSFALLAGMQLDLFTPLAGGPLTAEGVASELRVPPDRLEPLLYALVASGLLTVRNGRFANTPEAEHFLVRSSPSYVGNIHELIAGLWSATLKTAGSVRAGAPQARHDFSALPRCRLEAFFRGLHFEALSTGRALVKRHNLAACRRLLDVGGGSGGLSIAATEACPNLRATVLDLPEVTPITERFVSAAGATDRVRVLAADVTRSAPEGPFDIAVLKAFLQTLDPDSASRAVVNVAAALEPGGRIYILGNGILDDTRHTPPAAAAFNIVFLNIYDGGRAYTESEYRAWLTEAGFESVQRHIESDGSSLITARKPG